MCVIGLDNMIIAHLLWELAALHRQLVRDVTGRWVDPPRSCSCCKPLHCYLRYSRSHSHHLFLDPVDKYPPVCRIITQINKLCNDLFT